MRAKSKPIPPSATGCHPTVIKEGCSVIRISRTKIIRPVDNEKQALLLIRSPSGWLDRSAGIDWDGKSLTTYL